MSFFENEVLGSIPSRLVKYIGGGCSLVVERHFVELNVAGSSPVTRRIKKNIDIFFLMGTKFVKNCLEKFIIRDYIVDKNVLVCNYLGTNDYLFRVQMQQLGCSVRIIRKDFVNKYWVKEKVHVTGMGLLIEIGDLQKFPVIYKYIAESLEVQVLGCCIGNRLYQFVYFGELVRNFHFTDKERALKFLVNILIFYMIKFKQVLERIDANNKSVM